ncbi:AMP-binding protein [Parahaliea mediterranea]|uniref:AMP-binding protein n=1 Tax=Parahaliea mediterranea TaxID=651086 RepID=UPI001F4DC3DB|nr:AMP-binding protein [Parahaliea mediterranea]
MSSFNLADLFELVVDCCSTREAVVCGDQRRTFSSLESRSNQLAHVLQAKGIGPGDHVGIYLYNSCQYIETLLACFKLRAVPININYRYASDELIYLLNNADIKACILQQEFEPLLVSVMTQCPTLITSLVVVDDRSAPRSAGSRSGDYEEQLAAHSSQRNFLARSDDDTFILYTGGTTGYPKGVVWSHRDMFYAALGGGAVFSPAGPCREPEDILSRLLPEPIRGLALAPLMHGAAVWYALMMLLSGSTLILNPNRSLRGEQVWDLVEAEQVNAISLVGDAMAIPLLEALHENPGRWQLGSIVNIGSGGAVFSASNQAAFREQFPEAAVVDGFGSSESGQIGQASGSSGAGLTSFPASDTITVLSNTGRAGWGHATPGERGILARSGHIPKHYYNAPEKTAEVFVMVDGRRWLLTGDSARQDKNGEIVVFGRGSNCINSGGEKIFPEEVEQALKAHPEILDALVFGRKDKRWGQRVVALISTRNGSELNLDTVRGALADNLSSYKLPRELHCTGDIPRLITGKPDYATALSIAEAAIPGHGRT